MRCLKAADFFAGSGLVTLGLSVGFDTVWANDIDAKKAAVYRANHGHNHFQLGDISDVDGNSLPEVDLAWASSPCQDLSLAGKMAGLGASRSGMFWEWIRVLGEMPKLPQIICLENVMGLVSANSGEHFVVLHQALSGLGYRSGAMMLDAQHWLPQSRKRIFVVGILKQFGSLELEDVGPNWLHPSAVRHAMSLVKHPVWWKMPLPKGRRFNLDQVIEWDLPPHEASNALISLIPEKHKTQLDKIVNHSKSLRHVFPAYRRTRNGKQVLELRFDGCSGCLRTAEGGSSRQFLVLAENDDLYVRLMHSSEAAKLMGAPDSYILPGSDNEVYTAMGDAVAVPVVRHLAEKLFSPLVLGKEKLDASGTPFRLLA